MKRLLIISMAVGCAAVWTANAQEADKTLSPQAAQQRAAIIKKYDTNGDGVLNKAEQKALSKEDKQALAKTGGVGTAKKATEPKKVKKEKSKEAKPNKTTPAEKEGKPAEDDKVDKAESEKQ